MEKLDEKEQETMSLKSQVKTLVDLRFEGNISAFAAACGLSYTSALDWYYDRVVQVKFKTLETMCRVFGVGPGEILAYLPDNSGENKDGV